MFGLFSLPKLLLTAAIIAGVWYGFKWLNRRQAELANQKPKRTEKPRHSTRSKEEDPDIEEMVLCPDCGAYVAKGSNHKCG